MNFKITRPNGDLKREVWTFSLRIEPYLTNHDYIKWVYYQSQYKDNIRQRKWRVRGLWDSSDTRPWHSNIQDPPLPDNVKTEACENFAEQVKALEIRR